MAGSIRAVLTDIEGTTTAVRFVTETLFPYARARIPGHVRAHHADPAFAELFAAVRAEAGIPRDQGGPEALITTLLGWMDEDRKAGPLKTLQGLIWEDGYRDGTLVSHLYPDVAPALRAWRARGLRLAVYSSGSVAAQRLLFGHTSEGDLCPLFSAYFDTGSGPKREVQSYHNIRAALGVEPAGILFLSDVVAELDAARAAGLPTRWLVREGPLPTEASHTAVSGFDQISID